MNEELISENNILDSNYKYYLVEASCNEDAKYGIKIDKYNVDNKIVDSKYVQHVFESRVKTIKAIRILNKLQVTPITLEDVVIDNIYMR